MDAVAAALILVGSAFAALAGLGQFRYRDVFVRMHVATKPATLGLGLVLTGALLAADGVAPSAKLALAVALQFLTAPVAAHLIGRAAYQAGATRDLDLVIDELAGADELADAEAGDGREGDGGPSVP